MKALRQIGYLLLRSFKQSTRPYLSLMPEFVMPLFFFTINSSAFKRVVDIPGFGHDTYLQFYAPVGLLTAIFISSGSTGIEVVTDITTGYMDRLFLAPIKRWTIVFAKLAAVGVKSALLTVIMLVLFLLFGASFNGGPLGVALLLLYAFVFAMGWAGIGLTLAFMTKNPRVVQSSFIFFFPFSTITTAQLPLNLLEGWYKTAVQLNPVTYILEGIRAILVDGDLGPKAWVGLLVALGFALITLSIATRSFRKSVMVK